MSTESREPVISVRQLAVAFPACDVLRGIDLDVERGTVFALLGENGAGKTTLIRILTGYLKPGSGSCRVLGLDPVRDAMEIRRRVGYVSDAPALYDWMRVGEIGWFAAAFYAPGFIDRYHEAVERYEVPEDRKIGHLSKGQRAKVALALALAHDPELLILDEPTSGLDPLVRREFLESMLDRVATGRTVFLSSHQVAEVERVADTVAILHDGRFRVIDTLSRLRETATEIVVSLDDPLVVLPLPGEPAEILSDRNEGRQRRIVARGLVETQLDEWRARPGVVDIRVRGATLEELFAATVRGRDGMMTGN
ncbi:MAG: ABC transporter ATP-binding protein [Planctomycetes bacterium]|nr:ABC transporter ATP-binding protein [Planctomycetota bacterium]